MDSLRRQLDLVTTEIAECRDIATLRQLAQRLVAALDAFERDTTRGGGAVAFVARGLAARALAGATVAEGAAPDVRRGGPERGVPEHGGPERGGPKLGVPERGVPEHGGPARGPVEAPR